MRKSPEKGDAFAHMPTLALLHVAELRQTRTQAEIIQLNSYSMPGTSCVATSKNLTNSMNIRFEKNVHSLFGAVQHNVNQLWSISVNPPQV